MPIALRLRRHELTLSRPLVMGVVNVTPDSFSDGGRYASADEAIAHGMRLIGEGADILDVGGESSRPGAQPISVDEELRRVCPVLEGLACSGVPLSIDTTKLEVIRTAISLGVGMINDITALRRPGAMSIAADSGVGVCLMHMQGTPHTMQSAPAYTDVVREVREYLSERAQAALASGVGCDSIIIDPGFGFGKSVEDNVRLLRELDTLLEIGYPLMAGLSRKSVLGALTGRPVDQRVHASTSAALIAAQRGASILRVHDVAATRDALAVWAALA